MFSTAGSKKSTGISKGSRPSVSRLLYWQPTPGSGTTALSLQTYAEVIKVVESLPSARIGKWHTTCSVYRPIRRDGATPAALSELNAAREMFGVTFSEVPDLYFLVFRHEKFVVEADASMHQLMEKLQLYRHGASINYEGYEYRIGSDFLLRVGRAVLSTNDTMRGIIVEVEYLPARSLDIADTVLKEFIATWQDFVASHAARSTAGSGDRPPAASALPLSSSSLNGRFVAIEPTFAEYNLPPADFSWQHRALQLVLASAYLIAARP